jgi:hypothetical protein
MPSKDDYAYCARLGMTQVECATHLGVSRAAVTKAKRKHRLTFGNGMALSQGKQWEMEFYRYPWEKLELGDWCEVNGSASMTANRANVRLFPKRFRTVTRGGLNIVMRAA